MELLTNPDTWISFLTLCLLEIVLGIDNLIFISIVVDKLPVDRQEYARKLGLSLALVMRIALLFSISWVMGLTNDLFQIRNIGISGRDLILIVGGLFLMYKSVKEIHEKAEHTSAEQINSSATSSFRATIIQIIILDIIFSLDSVITAVGMVDEISVMVAAVVVSMVIMFLAAKSISDFVNTHPAIKILALAFLIMIGIALVAEGLDFHIPKGYIYFSMAFAFIVEVININVGTRKKSS